MNDKETEIAKRYEAAQNAWNWLMMRNVAGISTEQRVQLDLDVERARQELSDAQLLYRQMISDRVRRERLN